MGKTAAAAAVAGGGKKRKKLGRPSLSDLHRNSKIKSINPNINIHSNNEDDDDDDEDERKEKKVKLVVGLPPQSSSPSNHHHHHHHHHDDDDSLLLSSSIHNSPSHSINAAPNHDYFLLNSGSTHHHHLQGEKVLKAMDILHGSPFESGGPATPLPDKKLLLFILDRLQKKDTHAVFSDPVDPDELPDYHEIIKQPMDFGTVRSKLDAGIYSNLEELEADVYLICSNAMQYNSSDTIYFRQARSIQELAKRDFENLRQEGEDGELQPKVVKRGRPPGKQAKKTPGRPPLDRVGPESTSGATLATAEDNTTESTPYNLRKAPPVMYRFQADGLLGSHRSRNEHYSELLADWNEEFPVRIRRADMKYGNKNLIIDETRRDTYKQFHPSTHASESPLLSNLGGERRQLLAVGLHAEHGYARSLARFAANLGPVVWKIASKKIEKALPPGTKFGPGVVGENDTSPPPSSFFPSGNLRRMPSLVNERLPDRPQTSTSSAPNPAILNQQKDEAVEPYIRIDSSSQQVKNEFDRSTSAENERLGEVDGNSIKPTSWQQCNDGTGDEI